MKDCKGCVHELDKNMAWCGTAVHPCSNCIRVVETPVDKYRPREDCPTDPECPFCECGQEWVNHDPNKCGGKKPAECEHEWEYTAPPHRDQRCIKCGVKRIEPTQKPIEELDIEGLDRNFAKIERMADKINTLIKAVNGLYER